MDKRHETKGHHSALFGGGYKGEEKKASISYFGSNIEKLTVQIKKLKDSLSKADALLSKDRSKLVALDLKHNEMPNQQYLKERAQIIANIHYLERQIANKNMRQELARLEKSLAKNKNDYLKLSDKDNLQKDLERDGIPLREINHNKHR